nr:hypothetical protein [Streptomyces sp. GS7]
MGGVGEGEEGGEGVGVGGQGCVEVKATQLGEGRFVVHDRLDAGVPLVAGEGEADAVGGVGEEAAAVGEDEPDG